MEARDKTLLSASQMVGVGLSQLLVYSYQQIDEMEAEVKLLRAENALLKDAINKKNDARPE